jgi:hypothetical protein
MMWIIVAGIIGFYSVELATDTIAYFKFRKLMEKAIIRRQNRGFKQRILRKNYVEIK